MQISEKGDQGRSWSIGQMIVVGVLALVVVFVIVGSIGDASGPAQDSLFAPQQPFLILALLAFFGGVLSFLSPCTLPILPAYFAFAFQSGRRQIATNTMVFMLGVATMFSLFGAGASAIGTVLRQNQDLILLIGGALVVVFGVMSLMGRGFAGVQQDEERVQPQSLGGSYVFGMTFAAGWSTCIGPILGIILTMAATTGSVWRGTMLLFIYSLGLGLPLILVSTFLGRTSRKSLIWRVMKGKGWFLQVPAVVISVFWGLAAWLILTYVAQYSFDNFGMFAGQTLTMGHMIGLLVIALLGALLWSYTSDGGLTQKSELHLHTTQLVSGVLFLALGVLMLNGRMSEITAYFSSGESSFAELEGWLYDLIQ